MGSTNIVTATKRIFFTSIQATKLIYFNHWGRKRSKDLLSAGETTCVDWWPDYWSAYYNLHTYKYNTWTKYKITHGIRNAKQKSEYVFTYIFSQAIITVQHTTFTALIHNKQFITSTFISNQNKNSALMTHQQNDCWFCAIPIHVHKMILLLS